MHNGVGWLRGGLFTALCDEAMALALFTVLVDGVGIATISESTSFLEGVRSGRIAATGRVVKKGRSLEISQDDLAIAWQAEIRSCHACQAEAFSLSRPRHERPPPGLKPLLCRE